MPQHHIKVVCGSFHQGHEKFGETRDIQRMMNSLMSICFSSIKKIFCCKFWDLDAILEHGNVAFQKLELLKLIEINELPPTVTVSGRNIYIYLCCSTYGLLGDSDYFSTHNTVSSNKIGYGLIFTTAGYSFSIIWYKCKFYLFDAHSRNPLIKCNII